MSMILVWVGRISAGIFGNRLQRRRGDGWLTSIALTALAFGVLACGEPKDPQAANESQAPPEEKSAIEIHEIPTFEIEIAQAPEALPVHPSGLSFQMSKHALPPGARNYQPIGDAVLTDDNQILFSFPSQNQLVRFANPGFKTEMIGPRTPGDRAMELEGPSDLAVFGQRIFVHAADSEMVVELAWDGSLQDVHFVSGARFAVAGPNLQFAVYDPHAATPIYRVDASGKPVKQYLLPPPQPPEVYPQAGSFWIGDDWALVFASEDTRLVVHYQPDGVIKSLTHVDAAFLGHVQTADVDYFQESLWILYQQLDDRISYLLRLSDQGEIQALYRTPMFADGFEISKTYVLLFDKARGAAQTWIWNDVDSSLSHQ